MGTGNRTQTLDDSTLATAPGHVRLSHSKLRVLRPELYGIRGLWNQALAYFRLAWPQRTYIEEQLECGDSRAAVVISISPLLIAAYTDELDCIAMLRFPDQFVGQYHLSKGSRLLTVNCYGSLPDYDPDLILGPKLIVRWTGFHPVIADFLTDDLARVDLLKSQITEDEWARALEMGTEYVKCFPNVARDGRPVYSATPATRPRGFQ